MQDLRGKNFQNPEKLTMQKDCTTNQADKNKKLNALGVNPFQLGNEDAFKHLVDD